MKTLPLYQQPPDTLPNKKFFTTEKYILTIWMLLPFIYWMSRFFKNRYNNYKIFKGVFWHLINESNLYAPYPAEYKDVNHYGPLFGLIIAPFAALPDVIGCLLWGIFNTAILYYAINRLQLQPSYKALLMTLMGVELANSIWSNQFNPSITAFLILAYVLVEEKKDFWATLCIWIGAFIKIYSVVGLVFFLFSRNKTTFIAGCGVWCIILFVAPMAISSPEFVIQSYLDWYASLTEKVGTSISLDSSQDISVMGFVRRITRNAEIPNLPFLIGGALLVLLPLLRLSQYSHKLFRLYILSSLLAFVVLFSPGSEHPTYVICVAGICLALILQPEIFTKTTVWVLVFVIGWSGLSSTDLYSVPVRKFTIAYSLKAVPCLVAWLIIQYQLFFRDFSATANRVVLDRFRQ